MSLKDLPAEMRPREKLLARGGAALSDVELLALLLRTGLAGQGVFELATQVLREFDGFAGLLRADAADLRRIKGLGPAKRAEIAAVIEMARRALAQPLQAAPVFDAPQRVKDYVALHLGARLQEVFAVLFLDGQHRLLTLEELFHGTLSQTSVYPREVVKRALAFNAAALILVHNHPSGDPKPSREDIEMTREVKAAAAVLGIAIHDHLVIGRKGHASFRSLGLL